MEGLGGVPRRRTEIGVVLRERCGLDLAMIIRTVVVVDALILRGGQSVDLGDIEGFRDLGAEVERVGIIIRVRVV
jgi:hypothetical protein